MASKQTLRERLKPLIGIPGFTFFLSLYAFFSGFFPLYTVSQLTSMSRQFSMSSERSGFFISSSEFGSIVAAVVTGHFLSRAHRPRILFLMGCINALACAIATIPYFLDLSYDPTHGAGNVGADKGFCDANRSLNLTCDSTIATRRHNLNELVYAIFITSMILSGVATCGVWTIGVTYIDDNCEAKISAMYIGILFFVRFLSPVAALMTGAGFSALPLHLTDNGLTPKDRDQWISAWWLGYFVIGALNVLVSVPLLLFPRNLNAAISKDAGDDVTEDKNMAETKSVEMTNASGNDEKVSFVKLCQDFPATVLRLISNPILMLVSTGIAVEVGVAVAYPTFLPMYIEVYFKVTAWTANIVVGISAAAATAVGVLIGGFIIAKVPVTLNKMSAVATVLDFASISLFLIMLAINCDNPPVAGLTTSGQQNFTQECNQACYCHSSVFKPVCGDDGITYTNPCHAGCTEMTAGVYRNCSCINAGQRSARPEVCGEACPGSVAIYAVLLFIVTLIVSGAAMPVYMMLLRCTKLEDKSFALGIFNVMISLGTLPMPVLFGLLIKKACILVVGGSCHHGSSDYCRLYDNSYLRLILHIITFASRVLPGIFYALACVAARRIVFAGDSQIRNIDLEPKNLEKSDDKICYDNKAYSNSLDTRL